MDDMNEPKRRYFSGDSLQQALVQAANYFNLTPEEIAYKSLEKKHGFLKTRRKVVIEVNPDAPRREAPAPLLPPAGRTVPPPPPAELLSREPRPAPPVPAAPAPAPAAPPRSAEPERPRERRSREDDDRPRRRHRDRDGRGDRRPPRRDRPERPDRPAGVYVPEPRTAEGGLVTLPEKPRRVSERYPRAEGPVADAAANAASLLIHMAGLSLQPTIFQGEERLEVDLAGEDVDWCFADDGEFVMAVEHLLPRMIRSLSGETVAVRVDCENFHEIREERLRSLAQRVAGEVRRNGRPRILEPMNPADRRIIHVTLADDPGVVTESEGDGYFKRIMVRPA